MTSDKPWFDLCHKNDLIPQAGVCALLPDRSQVALFYIPNLANESQVFALENFDPFSSTNTLYHGIVGSLKDQLVVACPMHKQHFSLLSGRCIEDESVSLPIYEARLEGERVQIQLLANDQLAHSA